MIEPPIPDRFSIYQELWFTEGKRSHATICVTVAEETFRTVPR
jgi:hypothetical protein